MTIKAMNGQKSLEEFQLVAGIKSSTILADVLQYFQSNGIGNFSSDSNFISFTSSHRLMAAKQAIELGTDIEIASKYLSWHDFETFASEILNSFEFNTHLNFRLRKPRMEIDVVGIRSGIALLVDCKHWQENPISLIAKYANRQLLRARFFTSHHQDVKLSVPVILTLYSPRVLFVSKIPVIPIHKFRHFLNEFESHISDIRTISKEECIDEKKQ